MGDVIDGLRWEDTSMLYYMALKERREILVILDRDWACVIFHYGYVEQLSTEDKSTTHYNSL